MCHHQSTDQRPEGQCARQRESLVPRPGGEKERPQGTEGCSVWGIKEVGEGVLAEGLEKGTQARPQGLWNSVGSWAMRRERVGKGRFQQGRTWSGCRVENSLWLLSEVRTGSREEGRPVEAPHGREAGSEPRLMVGRVGDSAGKRITRRSPELSQSEGAGLILWAEGLPSQHTLGWFER